VRARLLCALAKAASRQSHCPPRAAAIGMACDFSHWVGGLASTSACPAQAPILQHPDQDGSVGHGFKGGDAFAGSPTTSVPFFIPTTPHPPHPQRSMAQEGQAAHVSKVSGACALATHASALLASCLRVSAQRLLRGAVPSSCAQRKVWASAMRPVP